MITQNDFHILKAVIDEKDKKKGHIETAGTTKKEIVEKTKLSDSKVAMTMKMLEKEGFVSQALKIGNATSFVITEKGMEMLLKLAGIKNINEIEGNA